MANPEKLTVKIHYRKAEINNYRDLVIEPRRNNYFGLFSFNGWTAPSEMSFVTESGTSRTDPASLNVFSAIRRGFSEGEQNLRRAFPLKKTLFRRPFSMEISFIRSPQSSLVQQGRTKASGANEFEFTEFLLPIRKCFSLKNNELQKAIRFLSLGVGLDAPARAHGHAAACWDCRIMYMYVQIMYKIL